MKQTAVQITEALLASITERLGSTMVDERDNTVSRNIIEEWVRVRERTEGSSPEASAEEGVSRSWCR